MTRNRSGLTRGSLAVAVACALVPAGLAAASSGPAATHKKKPVCNLVKVTPQNSQAWSTAGPATQPSSLDPSLQIVSADVATKGQLLTWVIRVKKLSSSYSSNTPTGRRYEFKFVANGVAVDMSASESQFGSEADPNLAHSKATFDTAHNQIRESVPFGDIANHFGTSISNGRTTLSDIYVAAQQAFYAPGVGNPPYGSNETVGPVPSTYLAGTPSCVKVGS